MGRRFEATPLAARRTGLDGIRMCFVLRRLNVLDFAEWKSAGRPQTTHEVREALDVAASMSTSVPVEVRYRKRILKSRWFPPTDESISRCLFWSNVGEFAHFHG